MREEVIPQLAGVRAAADGLQGEVKRQRELIDALNAQISEMGERLAAGMDSLDETIKPLVRDAGEVREVVGTASVGYGASWAGRREATRAGAQEVNP